MGSTPRPTLDEGNVEDIEGTSGDPRNPLVDPKPGQKGLPGGKELLESIMSEIRNGLPANVRARIEKQGKGNIAGGLRSAEDRLNRTFAASGTVPIGAKSDAVAGLQVNSNKGLNDLYTRLDELDLNTRNKAFEKYRELISLALNRANSVNSARLGQYQIDSSDDFDLGGAIGGLFGLGGNVIGGLASGGYL